MDEKHKGLVPPQCSALALVTLGGLDIRRGKCVLPMLKLRKTQALLVYLAMNSGPHSRSLLAGLLWGGQPEAEARRNLRHALNELRQNLGPGILAGDRLAIGLDPAHTCRVDALTFEAELEQDRVCSKAGEDEAAAGHLQAAVDLYAGEFLAGFEPPGCPEFEAWATRRRAWLQECALGALARRLGALGKLGKVARLQAGDNAPLCRW